MRLLLIDTGTKQLDGLRDIYAKHELDIVKAEDFSIEKVSGHAIVVVCGDYGQEHSSDAYQDLASFMQTGDIPVVGVGVARLAEQLSTARFAALQAQNWINWPTWKLPLQK